MVRKLIMQKAMNKATITSAIAVVFGLISLNCLKKESVSNERLTFWFVGFVKGNPVFTERSSNTIVALNEHYQREPLSKHKVDEKIIYFGDCGVATYSKGKGIMLFETVDNQQLRVASVGEVVSFEIDESCERFAYATYDSITVVSQSDRVFNFAGSFPQLTSEFIFFTSASDIGPGYVALHRVGIKGENNATMVLDGIFENGVLVLDEGRFVACEISVDGIPKKVIYSVEQEKFHVLNDVELQDGNYYPAYHPNRDSFFYYTPENLEVKTIDFPERFDFSRH